MRSKVQSEKSTIDLANQHQYHERRERVVAITVIFLLFCAMVLTTWFSMWRALIYPEMSTVIPMHTWDIVLFGCPFHIRGYQAAFALFTLPLLFGLIRKRFTCFASSVRICQSHLEEGLSFLVTHCLPSQDLHHVDMIPARQGDQMYQPQGKTSAQTQSPHRSVTSPGSSI